MRDESRDVQEAGRALLGLALSVANGLVGLTALGYLIGYRVLSAYYHAAGAPWAVHLSSSTQILSQAVVPIAFVAFSAFWCYFVAADPTVKRPKFVVAGAWIAGVAIVCQIVGLAAEHFHFLSLRGSYAFAASAAGLMAIAVGFYIGELLASLSDNSGRWTPHMLLLAHAVLYTAVWYSPGVLGSTRAQIDMNPKYSRLASVVLTSSEGEKWRFVSTLDSRALIAAFTDEEVIFKRFRLVDFAEIAEIRPWSKPADSGTVGNPPELSVPPGITKPNALPKDR